MSTIPTDLLLEDSLLCPLCGDMVPRGHTVLRADQVRVCWFCHTDVHLEIETDTWDDEEGWDDWD